MPAMVWFVIATPVLVFLPLGIAAAEHFIFGSSHFESFCSRIGIHDALDLIYLPVFRFFGR